MTHYAVLRHNFDVHRHPDRLGPLYDDDKFCLAMNGASVPPPGLAGNAVWLISWEGFMKTHHVVVGWFIVENYGKRHGVVAQHYVSGNDGELFARGLGPLDMHPWFARFVEANRRFRDGEPTDLGDYVGEMLTMARGAGYRIPAGSGSGQAAQDPAAL